jgi:Thrombospondin type 3 repeat
MPQPRLSAKASLLAGVIAAGLAASPSGAAAARPASPFDIRATITTCAGEGLTVAAEIAPAAGAEDDAEVQRGLRAVRGARLRLHFEAAPLYGPVRASRAIDLGRTTAARRFERFEDLPAHSYSGVVRYRWVRGSRTVLSGLVRTHRATIAGKRGRAFCSLKVGKKPVDTRPPVVFPLPLDSAWKRGPLNVYMAAFDDLSGVALVVSRVDSGPFRRGRNVQIATEGSHRLAYVARDAAGNQSAPAAVTLRVDMNPPTDPALTAPSGPTNDTTPEIRWNASTDSASGVQRYLALVRNSGGAIVWSQVLRATDPTAVTVGQALAAGEYTAEVYAVDGAAPQPFVSRASSAFSVVAPTAAPADTDSDDDGHPDTADNCPFTANADQANLDADGSGDACDDDDDGDGDADAADNCAVVANPDQANLDGDAAGDACDTDDDGDGDPDAADNCATVANADQADTDKDAAGDACDLDDDADSVADASDNCRTVANPKQRNTDSDATGDACDSDMDGDGTANASDSDIDGDGVPNSPNLDQCPQVPRQNTGQTSGCPADGDGF